ncbi:response regulator [bacterium 1XD42-8]|jgi:two-component system KDP operon response regulator KdpE|nr:response regulator [Lachnospiraceae bacterium]RKJ47542.1 response regulator [bacterium 1XD42-8]
MSYKLSVLIIEDEKNISSFICTTLTNQGYKVLKAATGKEGLSLLTSQCPDILLLDLGLPDMDGICLLKEVRTWSELPILVISARIQENEKVQALDMGADDYITKPFGTKELLARIRTAIRHSKRLNFDPKFVQKPYHALDLTIDFEKRRVLLKEKEIHLTAVEFKLVSLLAQQSGKVLTYDYIITQIWGPYADKNNRILRVNMANIRRKLEVNPAEPVYIFTEIGIGYRMIEDKLS